MRKNNLVFYIFSHNVEPNGISGGETILIETLKRIRKHFKSVEVYGWKPAKDLYTKYGLTHVTYRLSKIPVIPNFYISFIVRTFYGLWLGFSLSIPDPKNTFLYFSSDFWPDALPVVLLKLRYSQTKFVSNFFLAAPNPFYGFNEQKNSFRIPTINGLFFYFMQKPIYWFSRLFADFIFVTSEPDVDRFPRLKKENKYFVVKGGVNIEPIEKFKKKQARMNKMYDGVFIGRFHPQKGVLELLDIWKYVVSIKENAKLVMIGDGPLMPEVKEKIQHLRLIKNIILTGYIFDNKERYKIFMKSKVALHPAIYDSGGMAVAEAMAFGLPAVGFDLLALKTYYPSGMIKVKQGDKKKFATAILYLLISKNEYKRISSDAKKLIKEEWDWDKRAKMIAQKIFSLT